MQWLHLALALASSVAPAQAALRFACSQLHYGRLDPIVEPGVIPSAHVHQIVGGNAFNATMAPEPDKRAKCTTCIFTQDKSNYWTAVLYFRHRNGTYERVDQITNGALPAGVNKGMTVYYTQESFSSNGNQKITAFKPGFRMTVGSPSVRDGATVASRQGLRHVCMQNLGTRFPELANLPTTPCPGGIMAVHHFPSCWDGKNLDSPDHQSHMYITTKDAFRPAGPCPASHPVRMPQVAYETIWDTRKFNDKSLWPEAGSNIAQPFTWSFGDFEGYGTHADYLFGWEGDSLQNAMDHSCMFDACGKDRRGPLDVQPVADMNKCMDTMKTMVEEDIDGWTTPLSSLPGQAKNAGM